VRSRPDLDTYFLDMLKLVSSRSTCPRRKVGAIITDHKGVILATGYNGVPRGMKHCIDDPCPVAHDEHGNTTRCFAVHAEQNALLQCQDLGRAHTMYCNCTPCFVCAKLIAQTGIRKIVVLEHYGDPLAAIVLSTRGITTVIHDGSTKA
jgi:dCMP deaminase